MLLHGLRRGGAQLEGEHSGPMRLIHNCFSDRCEAAIAAVGHGLFRFCGVPYKAATESADLYYPLETYAAKREICNDTLVEIDQSFSLKWTSHSSTG